MVGKIVYIDIDEVELSKDSEFLRELKDKPLLVYQSREIDGCLTLHFCKVDNVVVVGKGGKPFNFIDADFISAEAYKAKKEKEIEMDRVLNVVDGNVFIDGEEINVNVFDQDMVEYKTVYREDEIGCLIQWISEVKNDYQKSLVMSDLKQLMSISDEYVFSSGSTNDYVSKSEDPENFNKICNEILGKNKELSEAEHTKAESKKPKFLKKSAQEKLIKSVLDYHVIVDEHNELSTQELVETSLKALMEDEVVGHKIDEDYVSSYIKRILSRSENVYGEDSVRNINILECEICSECGTVLLPNDECYEKHNGEAICSSCGFLCESCGKYYTKEEGVNISGVFTCNNCKPKFYKDVILSIHSTGLLVETKAILNLISGDVEDIVLVDGLDFENFDDISIFAKHGTLTKAYDAYISENGIVKISEEDMKEIGMYEKMDHKSILEYKDFINNIVSMEDFCKEEIRISMGNAYVLISKNCKTLYNSYNLEQIQFNNFKDFGEWYFLKSSKVKFKYQINIGERDIDGNEKFTDDNFSLLIQDNDEDGSIIWTKPIIITEPERSTVEFEKKRDCDMSFITVVGYWKLDNVYLQRRAVIRFDHTEENPQDDSIFYYFETEDSVIGDHGDFVVTSFWKE